MNELRSGAVLQGGKYRIERVLGQGGFGITYLATQTMLGCKVAIKEFFFSDCCERSSDRSRVSVITDSKKELVDLKSATKLFSVLLASKRPLITELADKLRLKYPLLPTISPCPTMRLEAIRSIIPISCRRYPKSV